MAEKVGSTEGSARWTTGQEVWVALLKQGGLDLQHYDGELAANVRNALEPKPPAKPLELEAFLQKHGTRPEPLLSAFFQALQPFSRMYVDIYSLLERIGTKYGQQNLRVKFEFEKADTSLEFDLHSFREQIERWRQLTRPLIREEWKENSLWDLLHAFEFPGHTLAELFNAPTGAPPGTTLTKWVQQYNQGQWPDVFLGPPQVTSPTLQSLLSRAWAVWQAIVTAGKSLNQQRDYLKQYPIPPQSTPLVFEDGVLEHSPVVWGHLRLLDSDLWAQSFARQIHELRHDSGGIVEQKLTAFLANIPREERIVKDLRLEIEELLSLPIWRKRYELYSIWVFTRIVGALGGPDDAMFHLENGLFHIPFNPTLVATFTRWEPTVALWAELRSPLQNPQGKGRKGNIQPDYCLAVDGTGGAHEHPQPASSDVIAVVECKQYLKANKRSFQDALHDYARGHPRAQVTLVNYGPAAPAIAAELASSFTPSPEVFGGFKPGCADLASGRFNSLLLRAIEQVCQRKIATPPLSNAPPDDRERIPTDAVGSIRLTWSEQPADLDLHLYLPGGAGVEEVYYRSPGSLKEAPWVWLANDIQQGRGPEVIHVAQVVPGRYRCVVHHYSSDGSLASSGASVEVLWRGRSLRVTCPAESHGKWWHVFDVVAPDGALKVVNALLEDKPK